MSKLNRLFDLASKALGGQEGASASRASQASSGSPQSGDWRSMAQGIADRVGLTPPAATAPRPTAPSGAGGRPAASPPAGGAADRAAIARYDYLMQTAGPHEVEAVHREAFERLTPAQRAQVQERMRAELPPGEQPRSADPADLARAAGRSEARRPGIMQGLLARAGGGRSLAGGAALAGGAGLLGLVAGGAIASAVAAPLLAAASGVDFDALAQGVDVDAIAGGIEGAAGDALGGVADFGDQASGAFDGFGDLF